MYHDYKSYFSIVLQALVDGHYHFISIDVGGCGTKSDGGTFSASSLSTSLEHKALGIPTKKAHPKSECILPYVIIADQAYPLKQNLLRPQSGHFLTPTEENFKKPLSRARESWRHRASAHRRKHLHYERTPIVTNHPLLFLFLLSYLMLSNCYCCTNLQ